MRCRSEYGVELDDGVIGVLDGVLKMCGGRERERIVSVVQCCQSGDDDVLREEACKYDACWDG